MISFLAPFALTGLAVLAVPIAIHLLKPRRVRVVPFSSLRWLRTSQHRFSRRIQWHQILLFLLRAAFLTLLVLAVARPVVSRKGTAGEAHRFVIVDTSRSMGLSQRDQPDPMAFARDMTDRILAQSGPRRPATVLVSGQSPRALGPLSAEAGRFLEPVRQLTAEGSEHPLTEALRLIPALQRASAVEAEAVELFFVTSNIEPSWRQDHITGFLEEISLPVQVQILEAIPPMTPNGWIASAGFLGGQDRARRRIRVQLGASGPRRLARTLRLSGIEGMADAVRDITLEPGKVLWQEFSLPPGIDVEKQVALLMLEPADALADDDRFWLRLQPRGELKVMIIEPEGTQIREQRPGFHLQVALETLSEIGPGRFSLSLHTLRTLRDSDLRESGLIFWVEPTVLPDPLMAALRERIAGGGGLVVFPGPSMDADFFSQQLYNPLDPGNGLLTREAGSTVQLRDAQQLVQMEGFRWDHPLLNTFLDPAYGDLASAEFGTYLQLPSSEPPEGERILTVFPDQTPAMIESLYGAGRVLLLNTTADDRWGDLPRRRGFLPLLDNIISGLTGLGGGGVSRVGEPLRLTLPPGAVESSVRFSSPMGVEHSVDLLSQGGHRILHVPALTRPGVYTLRLETDRGESLEEPVAVQTARTQSALTPMDREILKRWWEPAELFVSERDRAIDRLRVIGAHRLPVSWLLALAVLCLVAETILCCYWCPRASKVAPASAIAQHGFFARPESAGQPSPSAGQGETS